MLDLGTLIGHQRRATSKVYVHDCTEISYGFCRRKENIEIKNQRYWYFNILPNVQDAGMFYFQSEEEIKVQLDCIFIAINGVVLGHAVWKKNF